MSHNIQAFLATVGAGNSLMRPNQFELSIPGMPKWASSSSIGDDIRFYCSQASLPGANIDAIDIRRYGMGYLEYFPTGVSFYDLQTTFYSDQNADIVKFFQTWIRNIVNFDPSQKASSLFRVQYRDQYISQIAVTQFDTEGLPILEYTYVDAFPVNIQPIGVRWFSRDEVTEFEVIWKYRVWTERSISSNSDVPNMFESSPSTITGLPGFGQLSDLAANPLLPGGDISLPIGNIPSIISNNVSNQLSTTMLFGMPLAGFGGSGGGTIPDGGSSPPASPFDFGAGFLTIL